ncbi:hypothetical protein [Kitasatospora sp. NPDC090091]|uniref:hypothetical protein n=1 Tax=Kitasatospora sp. NPDC090091 TaxID=3364081 RepID=UPI0038122204
MSEINNDDVQQAEHAVQVAALREQAVQAQRDWYAAEAAWVAAPDDRAAYEAFSAAGLRLHAHAYWAAAGGNRFELQKSVREDARKLAEQS